MKVGKLTPQGAVEYDGWEKVYEHEISASDTEAQLLATFQGADGDTSGSADTGQTITFNGTAQLDTAQAKIGNASLLLDGNSDYVTVPDSDDWDFGTGDFTIDCWARFNVIQNSMFISARSGGGTEQFYFRYTGEDLQMYGAVGGVSTGNYSCSWTPSVDTWYHIAVVRNSSTCYLFIDGVSQAVTETTAWGTMPNVADVLNIGRYAGGSGYVDGHMDGFRITKGTALWTSNFTPPTTIDDYVSTSAITIFGLAGDTDEQYMLDCALDNGGAGNVGIMLRINGDSGTNYGHQRIYGADSTISAFRAVYDRIDAAYFASSSSGQFSMLLHAKSGYVRTDVNTKTYTVTGTTVTALAVEGHSWNNTANEITALSVYTTSVFAVGSTISLYRRISA